MRIIKTEEIDGYTVNTYDNEAIEKYLIGSKVENAEHIPEPEPTDEEILQAEMLLNQQEILINQQSQDEVLAEILLGQQTM